MTTLEQKVNLVMKWILAEDTFTKYDLELAIQNALNEEPIENNISVDDMLNDFLMELGIAPNIKGFGYIACAIKLIINEPDRYNRRIIKGLYPAIAETFGDTPSRVERNIRTAVNMACNHGLLLTCEKPFGNLVDISKDCPSSAVFLATCAVEFERKLKNSGVRV